jgi:cell division protein FtsQ
LNYNTHHKSRKRSGSRRFFLSLFVLFSLALILVLTGGLFFKLKEIRVEGMYVTSREDIVRLSNMKYGDNIVLLNKLNASRNIISNLTYITDVRIKREWPSAVLITVTESAPTAMIDYDGRYWLFDAAGTMLENSPYYSAPKLPVVNGISVIEPVEGESVMPVAGEEAKLGALISLLSVMQKEGIWSEVKDIDLSQISNIRFTFRDIYNIEMGMPESIDKKTRKLLLALEDEKIARSGPGTFYLAAVSEEKYISFIPDTL